MADKKTRRREKKLAKDRIKSKQKSAVVRSRRRGGASAMTTEKAAHWPVHECYVSENWHDQGPRLHAILSRVRDDGRLAVAMFEVDLMAEGVISAEVALDWQVPGLQRAVVERSESLPMITCVPDLIVKIIEEGSRHGIEKGHTQAAGLTEASKLFGELRAEDCTYDILVGDTPPEKPKRTGGGVLDSLKRAFVRR